MVHDYCIDRNPAIIDRIKGHFRKEKIITEIFIGKGYCCSLPVKEIYTCLRKLAKEGETIYAKNDEEQGAKVR